MIRSFSYAAYAALFAFTVHAPGRLRALEPWADAWQHWVSSTFLAAYHTTLANTRNGESQPSICSVRSCFLRSALPLSLAGAPDT